MNLKTLPREIEELILSHILPIEYQKKHKKKMKATLKLINQICYEVFMIQPNLPIYKPFWFIKEKLVLNKTNNIIDNGYRAKIILPDSYWLTSMEFRIKLMFNLRYESYVLMD